MARFMGMAMDIAIDLFLAGGDWGDVRTISAVNGAAIAAERRRYVSIAGEV